MRRILFYSIHDLATGYSLKEIEKLLLGIDFEQDFEINDLIEFYNIKLHFDNSLFLNSWDDQTKTKFLENIEVCWLLVKDFWRNINDDNILPYFEQVEFQYRRNFWELIYVFAIYKEITSEAFDKILLNYPNEIRSILKKEKIVTRFSNEIRLFLLGYPESAELFLTNTEEYHSQAESKYIFPKCLTVEDRENIVIDYLSSENPNLNYVSLIEVSKDLKLSPKTRLLAKRVNKRLTENLLESNLSSSQVFGVEIGLDKDQKEAAIYSNKDNTFRILYSDSVLNNLLEKECLTLLFSRLFDYTDIQGLITLVSKINELDTLENVFMRSKNGYHKGYVFSKKDMLSLSQLILVQHQLKIKNKSLEDLFKKHFLNIAVYDKELQKIRFEFPSENLTFIEKIRAIAPELESLLKQYQHFIDDGEIDFELIELSSNPLNFSQLKSRVRNKYIYAIQNSKIMELYYYFFSNQGMLHYVEPHKEKYENFYSLLVNEDISLDSFEDYQKELINKLLLEDYLFTDKSGFLKIQNPRLLFLIGELYNNEVLSYWHFPLSFREQIDMMIQDKLLYSESSLFTLQEIKYFNYCLNKKDFTDGLDLRNKYLHGTNTTLEKDNEMDYYMLLRLVILVLLKIEDDLSLYQESTN